MYKTSLHEYLDAVIVAVEGRVGGKLKFPVDMVMVEYCHWKGFGPEIAALRAIEDASDRAKTRSRARSR